MQNSLDIPPPTTTLGLKLNIPFPSLHCGVGNPEWGRRWKRPPAFPQPIRSAAVTQVGKQSILDHLRQMSNSHGGGHHGRCHPKAHHGGCNIAIATRDAYLSSKPQMLTRLYPESLACARTRSDTSRTPPEHGLFEDGTRRTPASRTVVAWQVSTDSR